MFRVRMGRLEVRIWDESRLSQSASVRTTNVRQIEVDLDHPTVQSALGSLRRDEETVPLPLTGIARFELFRGRWRTTQPGRPVRRYGPAVQILDGRARLAVVIGTLSRQRELVSVAQRISHDLYVYGRLDVEMMLDTEALSSQRNSSLESSHIVVIGGPADNAYAQYLLSNSRSPGEPLHVRSAGR
jgi:hypothetical protein